MKSLLSIGFVIIFLLSGCAGIVKPDKKGHFNSVSEAAQVMASSIAAQTGFILLSSKVPVDAVTNEASAEIPASGKELQNQLAVALSKAIPLTKFEPINAGNAKNTKLIVLTSFASAEGLTKEGKWLRLEVALAEVETGKRLAVATGYLSENVFSPAPIRYYKDAPIYNTKDTAFQAKIAAIRGTESKDLGLTLNLSMNYAEGIAYYEDGQYSMAAKKFFDVLKLAPDHLGALSGLYQSYWFSGLKKEAEQAFLMLAETAINNGAVAMRIVFSVGSTNFLNSGDLQEQYAVWQKGLALATVNRNRCLNVIGHASRTGSESYNERLSLQRAVRISNNMVQLVPSSKGRLKAVGKGSSEVIVGNGADDMSDAIDRRVEFALRDC